MTKFQYHPDGEIPKNGEIFVFGSNLAGRHGAGAAKVALEKFGAVFGKGTGWLGDSYAIPTKDSNLGVLPLSTIKLAITEFIEIANLCRNTTFYMTRVACGLAGYKDKEIAPLFSGCGSNCIMPEPWKKYLELNSEENSNGT